MKVGCFRSIFFKEKYEVIEKFLSVRRLDGFVLCIQGWRKTLNSKYLAACKR